MNRILQYYTRSNEKATVIGTEHAQGNYTGESGNKRKLYKSHVEQIKIFR